MVRKALPLTLVALALLVPAAPAGTDPQSSIALPDEFRPEGIASGKGATFYVGSIPLGAVWRGSYETGEGAVLVPPHPGRNHTGLKLDKRFDRLFVAGGASKGIYVYDALTGEAVASFALADAGFVNDVVLTRRAAYFTDSQVQQLYRVGIGRDGSLSAPERIPLSGELVYTTGFNANGIEAVRGGRTLIVVKGNTGQLYRVDARTGVAHEIELDQPVVNGDGLLLRGDTLYVVQNFLNRVAVVELEDGFEEGEVEGFLTDPRLDVPTTIAPFEDFIYAVNARFDRPDDSDDDVVRLSADEEEDGDD
jgi:outer membrane protein assembly factor BamB